MRHLRFLAIVLPLFLLLVPAYAQSDIAPDSSGNGLLKGLYNFRHVVWLVGDDVGNLRRSVSLSGQIEFDGAGSYSLRASVMDSTSTAPQTYTTTGKYTIAASGFGSISSPVLADGSVTGLVSQGIFIASSTEDIINDLFIAVPAGSPLPNTASFNGKYWVTDVNFPGTSIELARDSLFQVNPDGQGNLGNVSAIGYIGGSGRKVSQTVSFPTYSFNANGVGTMSFRGTLTNANLLAGDQILYISPDGNFIFGGSATGWNMFVGVRALSESAKPDLLSGLYYQAGVDVDEGQLEDGYATIHTYYGSFSANSGVQINHQRLLGSFDEFPYDYTYSDPYSINTDGIYEDFIGFQNIIGAGGAIRIGFAQGFVVGISVGIKAPRLTGPDVFLDPTATINSASFAPFTVGLSGGELITLKGTGLAAEASGDETFPATLGGVQVMVNDRPAPIRAVSPTSVLAIVPFGLDSRLARIQVINNGVASNSIVSFMNLTTPGVFTVPPGGAGYADAVHADGSAVTPDRPALIGETISVFLTGLGETVPTIMEGTIAPSDPLAQAKAATAAYLDGSPAKVEFAGLAPGLIGLYRMDITVPTDVVPGDVYLDISGPDSYTSQVQVPVDRKSTLDPWPDAKTARAARARPAHRPRGKRRSARHP